MNRLILLTFLGLIAYVYSEKCTLNADCQNTSCATGTHHVICEHKAGVGVVAGEGLCTCAVNNYTCLNRDSCLVATVDVNCVTDDHIHCYDGKCICSRF